MVGGNGEEMLWPLPGPVSQSYPEMLSMEPPGQDSSS